MIPPLVSGRTWEHFEPEERAVKDAHGSELRFIRDAADHDIVALFKTPAADRRDHHEIYMMGMEWVASALARRLSLPVQEVYLENVDGEPGAVLMYMANTVSWRTWKKERRRGRLSNARVVPLCFAFDVWLANVDRYKKNILFEPVPRDTEWTEVETFRLVLIDHEQTGLWMPGKFGGGMDDTPQSIDVGDGTGVETLPHHIQKPMDGGYVSAYRSLSPDAKERVCAQIKEISDEEITGIVEQVPDAYMTSTERLLTIAMLKGRRDQVDSLCDQVLAAAERM